MRYSQVQIEQLNLIFEHCTESIIIFDEYGNITDFNKIAGNETGYQDKLSDVNITTIYPAIEKDSKGKIIFKSLENDRCFDMVAYRKNQTCFPVKLKLVCMQHGETRLGICLASNDSERNEAVRSHQGAMERVEEATKMKNEFLANITHELRTPINGMKGMIDSLAETELTQAQAETVGIISRCCNNMTKIINDLLDFSKLEAGKLSVEYREFNFKKFLDETLAFNVGRINEKGLKLIVDVSSDIPPFVVGDELRLGQVLNNLFSNAVKFTSEGHIGLEIATTQISATQVELMFMIIDTGIGISNEDLTKLFQSFSQVDGSITRRFGGTGLGLAICKQLVELMGGSIRVDSEKGKGSTFTFTVKFGIGRGAISGEIEQYPVGKFVYDKKDNISVAAKAAHENTGITGQTSDEGAYRFVPLDVFELENSVEKIKQQIADTLEKIDICMELEAWEKAEEFANEIRNLVPQEEKDLKRMAFQMLLAVRKEDYDKAVETVEEMEKQI